ncbi:FkbM family methyltransferase [Allorhodopirellula heiligendammensis]|nr:FkbM family methyltransferase [Allorhodopirellula heiligendammensis]
MRFVLARLLMATGLCRCLKIKQREYLLRFHPANLSSQLWIDPGSREDSLRFFVDYLKPGDYVVDVGANIGDTVLTSSRCVGPEGHVIGIEAHPRTFAFFTENLRLNRITNVSAINSAVGAERGVLRFSDDRRDDMNRVGIGSLEVPVDRLDNIASRPQPVALLKIDVEGYEKYVVEGAPKLLERTQCVFFEVSSVHFARFGYKTGELLEQFTTAGFHLFKHVHQNEYAPISTTYETKTFENLLAIRDESNFRDRTSWIKVPISSTTDHDVNQRT